jgi:hypothetical protein
LFTAAVMAFRVNSDNDYGVANALGVVSCLIAGDGLAARMAPMRPAPN